MPEMSKIALTIVGAATFHGTDDCDFGAIDDSHVGETTITVEIPIDREGVEITLTTNDDLQNLIGAVEMVLAPDEALVLADMLRLYANELCRRAKREEAEEESPL
jgi:hypothetical protein